MKYSSYLIYIILLIISIGCVRKDTITNVDAKYTTSTKLRELTNIPFPEVVFVEGSESRYVGGNSKEYKLFISSSKGKKKLVEDIKKELERHQTDWSQSDTTFSFFSHNSFYNITNNEMENIAFMVSITIPKVSSNDTIYVQEHFRYNTPKK